MKDSRAGTRRTNEALLIKHKTETGKQMEPQGVKTGRLSLGQAESTRRLTLMSKLGHTGLGSRTDKIHVSMFITLGSGIMNSMYRTGHVMDICACNFLLRYLIC